MLSEPSIGATRVRTPRGPSMRVQSDPPVTTSPPPAVPPPFSMAMVEENARVGSPECAIGNLGQPGSIEGYADRTSARFGDVVRLFVSTTAPSFHVEAYRMGWYRGVG